MEVETQVVTDDVAGSVRGDEVGAVNEHRIAERNRDGAASGNARATVNKPVIGTNRRMKRSAGIINAVEKAATTTHHGIGCTPTRPGGNHRLINSAAPKPTR